MGQEDDGAHLCRVFAPALLKFSAVWLGFYCVFVVSGSVVKRMMDGSDLRVFVTRGFGIFRGKKSFVVLFQSCRFFFFTLVLLLYSKIRSK